VTFRDTREKPGDDRRTSGPSGKVPESQRHTKRLNVRMRPSMVAKLWESVEAAAAGDQAIGQEPTTMSEVVEAALTVLWRLTPTERAAVGAKIRADRRREEEAAARRRKRRRES
jgi:hypothetical protein